jgi:Mrp family chromosome partitioning ATPase
MTRIYEALEQFDLDNSGVVDRSLTIPQVIKKENVVTPDLSETLIGLYRTIFNSLPGPHGRIIQFVESGKGSACSKVIRAFAKVSSSILKKSVLLLDSDPQLPINFDFFNHQSRLKWINELQREKVNNASKNLLSVSRLSMEPGLLPVDLEPMHNAEFMDRLKQTFDLVLVDSWSVSIPPKPMLFSPHVDGVVLVVDAGKTRWQIAEQQKRELTAQGGNVLGVILNNRTYPIPESIYKRL